MYSYDSIRLGNIMKYIRYLTIVTFMWSSVVSPAAFGVTTLPTESPMVPSSIGRITGGKLSDQKRLVVYIQDLHCNPEVQRNISNIINLLDTQYGVNRIFVEGAPSGKLDTTLITSIPDEQIKMKIVENLLGHGLLTGAEHFSITRNRDILFGLEQWPLYLQNVERYRRITEGKPIHNAVIDKLTKLVNSFASRHQSGDIRRLERFFNGVATEKHYLKLEKYGSKFDVPVSRYPNLARYLRTIHLKRALKEKKLKREMASCDQELRHVVPFQAYKPLADAFNYDGTLETYCQRLSSVLKIYYPAAEKKYAQVSKFLELKLLSSQINPIDLLEEECLFRDRLFETASRTQIDKDTVFMSRMTAYFRNYASLQITPGQYRSFTENIETFKRVLQKYFSQDEIEAFSRLLDSDDMREYYAVNMQRNGVFLNTLSRTPISSPISADMSARSNALANDGSAEVVQRLSQFRDIDIVIAGGFHSDVTGALNANGISCLTITPAMTTKHDADVYSRVMGGQTVLRQIFSPQTSALAAMLLTLGVTQEQIEILTASLLGAEITRNPGEIREIFDEWKTRNLRNELLQQMDVSYAADKHQWVVTFNGEQVFRLDITNNTVDILQTANPDDAGFGKTAVSLTDQTNTVIRELSILSEEAVTRLQEKVLYVLFASGMDNSEYVSARGLFEQYRRNRNSEHLTGLLLNRVTLPLLNVMGILANRASNPDEISGWRDFFENMQPVRDAIQLYNPPAISQFLLRTSPENRGASSGTHLASLDEEELSRKIAAMTDFNGSDVVTFAPVDPPRASHESVSEVLVIIKPQAASSNETIMEIARRARDFGYAIAGMKLFDGKYFRSHPDKIGSFYQEAYDGYTSELIAPSVMKTIKHLYDTPEFEFLFGVPFSEDMVRPAESLQSKWHLSEKLSEDLCEVGWHPISFEQFKERFSIDDITVKVDGIQLIRGDKEYTLPRSALGDDQQSIVWFRTNVACGMNKVGQARSVFPVFDPRVSNGRPVLVMNGYVPQLLSMFMEGPETRTVALVLRSVNGKSARWKEIREQLFGDDNNPRGANMAGTIRKDGVLGEVPLPFDPADESLLNGQKNIVHSSNSPLEALAEMLKLFDLNVKETAFGRLLLDNGYSEDYIDYLIHNPLVVVKDRSSGKTNKQTLFELSAKKDPADALKVIQHYFPSFDANDPLVSPAEDFAGFLALQQRYINGEISLRTSTIPQSDIEPCKSNVNDFDTIVSGNHMGLVELDRAGLDMVSRGEIAEIMPAGGTSGRFFGYKTTLPEFMKIKQLAKVWEVFNQRQSSIQLKLSILRALIQKAKGGNIPVAYLGSGNNIAYLHQEIKKYGIYPAGDLYPYAAGEVPRLNPSAEDMRASGAALDAQNYTLAPNVDAEETIARWISDYGDEGEFFRTDDGSLSGKPLGHFEIISKLVLSRHLLRLMQRGVKVVHIANGDDVAGAIDPAKAAYLVRNDAVDMLALLVEKNTIFTVQSEDACFSDEVRKANAALFKSHKKFTVVMRGGDIVHHNLPDGIVPALNGAQMTLTYNHKTIKAGISGKQEKGGNFVHVKSKQKDMILDQPLDGNYFSSNQLYIKTEALLRLFDLTVEEYAHISQQDLMKRVQAVTARMTTHVEIKPVAVGNQPGDESAVITRPAAQFARYVGEITGLLQAQPVLIDRDGHAGREGYSALKEPEDVEFIQPIIDRIIASVSLDPGINPAEKTSFGCAKSALSSALALPVGGGLVPPSVGLSDNSAPKVEQPKVDLEAIATMLHAA